MKNSDIKGKFYIDTLGCPKNVNDSEYVSGLLQEAGFLRAQSPEEADYVIVNTCGFIEDAKVESIDHIFSMDQVKKSGSKLIVIGCLVQRYAKELYDELEEADGLVGLNDYERLPQIMEELSSTSDSNRLVLASKDHGQSLKSYKRSTFSDKIYSSTIKIAEGCDKRCSYCAIPDIRGSYRSKAFDDIIKEARELGSHGCKEISLIAEDTSLYGLDLYGKIMFPELLRAICKVDGIEWIRILYCYDDNISPELIRVMREEDKICKYIDIPLQHGSNKVLKEMNRRSNRQSIHNTVKALREGVPGIRIRTTLIVGFPGETEEDYGKLMQMVEEEKFDRLGAFKYSAEEGTPAGIREDQISEEVKEERLDALMRRQIEISRQHNMEMRGKTYKVIVDEINEDGTFTGRTEYDAPEIDNGVIFTSRRDLHPGDFTDVLIEDAFDYDLVGSGL